MCLQSCVKCQHLRVICFRCLRQSIIIGEVVIKRSSIIGNHVCVSNSVSTMILCWFFLTLLIVFGNVHAGECWLIARWREHIVISTARICYWSNKPFLLCIIYRPIVVIPKNGELDLGGGIKCKQIAIFATRVIFNIFRVRDFVLNLLSKWSTKAFKCLNI